MTEQEFSAALLALGLGQAAAAKALGVGQPYVSMLCGGKRAVSDSIAIKIRKMIADIPLRADWEFCPRCGGTMRLKPSGCGSGVAVIHRCPAADGVIVKTTLEPMGVTADQAKAALGRRPGKQNGGKKNDAAV